MTSARPSAAATVVIRLMSCGMGSRSVQWKIQHQILNHGDHGEKQLDINRKHQPIVFAWKIHSGFFSVLCVSSEKKLLDSDSAREKTKERGHKATPFERC